MCIKTCDVDFDAWGQERGRLSVRIFICQANGLSARSKTALSWHQTAYSAVDKMS